MRKVITSILCLLLAAVLISLGGYFLTSRSSTQPEAESFEDFQFVVAESSAGEDEITYTYTDIEYTEDGFVPSASEVITQICRGEDMLVIAQHPELKYTLMNDIDMSGIDWVPVPLTGSFDGQGHAIYNLTVSRCSTEGKTTFTSGIRPCEDTRFAGLFSTLDNAEVSNLKLVGAYINIEAEQSCYAGTIAGYANNALISGCSIDSHIQLYAYGANNGIGGVLGYGSAKISGCTVNSELLYSDMHSPDQADGSVGGILGDGYALITGCAADADIYATANMYLYCGGIVGQLSTKDLTCDDTAGISSCATSGEISFGFRNASSRPYTSAVFGYVSGVRLSGLADKDYVSKISNLSPVTGNIVPECDNPDCIETVSQPNCKDLGYTVHTCKNCGYSYTDSYVFPFHTEMEPKFIEAPKPGVPGTAEVYCEECGKLLYTATVETSELPPPLSLSYVVLDIEYGSSAVIDASNPRGELSWSSDNPDIASVDENGRVNGLRLGSTAITCTDGETTVNCKVNVSYSSEQLFYRKFLFGWLWMD